MSAQIINGKEIASKILEEIKQKITSNSANVKIGIIQANRDEATNIYIRNKVKKAEEVGIKTQVFNFDESVKQEELITLIKDLNENNEITGFFIQTPIYDHLNLNELIENIDPKKDVDGMTPYNLGSLMHGRRDIYVAATAVACYTILKYISNYEIKGKHAVIVGSSIIMGKPLFSLLLEKGCTVTLCNRNTQNLKELCKEADILVSCTGVEKLITKDFVKEGAFVIDCGSPKAEVDFENVKEIASYITPVPGGVGPITIASLLKNCVKFI